MEVCLTTVAACSLLEFLQSSLTSQRIDGLRRKLAFVARGGDVYSQSKVSIGC